MRKTHGVKIGGLKVVFDTDMVTDFDDVGALACLRTMAAAAEVGGIIGEHICRGLK